MLLSDEAIVLKSSPFQETHQMVTLFTQEHGLFRALGTYSRSSKSALFGMLTPLNQIEVVFRPTRGSLVKVQSASLINAHTPLRSSYERLDHACKMLNCVSNSQFPNKPTPELYQLLRGYLGIMAEAQSPEAILASLQLKLLRHEGLLSVTNKCPLCGNEPEEIAFDEGKTVCASHFTSGHLNQEETSYFYALALATSTKLLKEIEPPESLLPKVTSLFETLMREL